MSCQPKNEREELPLFINFSSSIRSKLYQFIYFLFLIFSITVSDQLRFLLPPPVTLLFYLFIVISIIFALQSFLSHLTPSIDHQSNVCPLVMIITSVSRLVVKVG